MKALLKPTPENTYRITYQEEEQGVMCNFGEALTHSHQQEDEGDIEGACNSRFFAFQQLMELIPDSTGIELEWDDENSQDAMLLIGASAIDHFLVGDFEMTAAMLEMLLELDPEDHLYASKTLAYVYVALEEYESFDEVIYDVSDKYPDKVLLTLWSEFRRSGKLLEGELHHFKHRFKPYFDELVTETHPVDELYLREVESDRPSQDTLTREFWLKTEHLWELFPGFIEALRAS